MARFLKFATTAQWKSFISIEKSTAFHTEKTSSGAMRMTALPICDLQAVA